MKQNIFNRIIIVACAFIALFFSACNEGMNDEIQTNFFGVEFGASREEVVKAVQENGFKMNYSDDSYSSFVKENGSKISFGDMEWSFMSIDFYNDRFNKITFFSDDMKSKKDAEDEYNHRKWLIEKKYSLEDYSDGTGAIGKTKEGQYVRIYYSDRENYNHEKVFSVYLIYGDESIPQSDL